MDIYSQIASKIISDQVMIMGPLATQIARRVGGLALNGSEVSFFSDPKKALQDLVVEYGRIFGDASVEICKESAHNISINTSDAELPEILK